MTVETELFVHDLLVESCCITLKRAIWRVLIKRCLLSIISSVYTSCFEKLPLKFKSLFIIATITATCSGI